MELRLSGLWDEAFRTFPELRRQVPAAINAAMAQEANELRKRIVRQFTEQKPIGGTWKPLSALTLRSRRVQGFGGSKILIRTADLRNSVQVVKMGAGVFFVGVNRTAGAVKGGTRNQRRSASSRKAMSFRAVAPSAAKSKPLQLVNLGLVHEFGATVKVKVTAKMIRYFFGVLLRGQRRGSGGGGGGGKFRVGATLTIRIPARPFMRPAVEAMTPAEYETAIAIKIAVILRGKLGQPRRT